MKNEFNKTLTYKCNKYCEVLDEIDQHRVKLSELIKTLVKLEEEIKLWKPTN